MPGTLPEVCLRLHVLRRPAADGLRLEAIRSQLEARHFGKIAVGVENRAQFSTIMVKADGSPLDSFQMIVLIVLPNPFLRIAIKFDLLFEILLFW